MAEAYLIAKDGQLSKPHVDAVQFFGYAQDYPEWFMDFMEDDLYRDPHTGTWFYGDIALDSDGWFLKNCRGNIAYITNKNFNKYYIVIPF